MPLLNTKLYDYKHDNSLIFSTNQNEDLSIIDTEMSHKKGQVVRALPLLYISTSTSIEHKASSTD